MSRFSGVSFFFLMAAVCMLGCAADGNAQTNAALTPPPNAAPVVVNPTGSGDLDAFLKFDANEKLISVTNGTEQGHFSFSVTNVSSEDVTINYIVGSCHCTVAQLPSQPWKLAPKQVGEFEATMDLAGTPPGGTKFKTLTVSADKGMKVLNVTTRVLPDMSSPEERTNNVKMSTADRQAVFKGDCASCHADTAKDSAGHAKMGQDLYAAVCGVCHEAAHRATFVPDLHHLAEPTSAAFWRNWITSGKRGTLMPAFATAEGGILSNEQVDSLVKYLSDTVPAQPTKLAAPSSLRVIQ